MDIWTSLLESNISINIHQGVLSPDATLPDIAEHICGVFHLAGILANATIKNQNRTLLEQVWYPKVTAAIKLYNTYKADSWVFFSSIASILGSAGQANYAAANACLDAMAAVWRQKGENATSIQWGPWGETGLAVRQNVLGKAAQAGIGGIPTDTALRILYNLIQKSPPVALVASMNWRKYFEQHRSPVKLVSDFNVVKAVVKQRSNLPHAVQILED